MLETMRELALDFLHDRLGGKADEAPEVFYDRIRETAPEQLFPFLVENVEKKAKKKSGRGKPKDAGDEETRRYYTLGPAEDDPTVAILEALEIKPGDTAKLPFNQPSGPNSPAMGPVVKRMAKKGGELNSPKEITQDRTLAYFKRIGDGTFSWSSYFAEAQACWSRSTLRSHSATTSQKGRTAYSLALNRISEKKTVIVAFKDAQGRLPGEVPEYIDYLRQQLAQAKYLPDSTVRKGMTCPLCGDTSIDGYPNALRGAGVNLANVNRAGAFAGLDASSAWKSFALCLGCADLLYVFCKHVQDTFQTKVADADCLALPTLNVTGASRKRFVTRLRNWVTEAHKAVKSRERQLLKALGVDASVNSITLIWATFGNRIEDIVGVVTDVLPSRLNELSQRNEELGRLQLPIFPDVPLEEFEYDLSLSILRPLLDRPGGKKAKSRNESRRLFDLRRDIADAIYHGRTLPWNRFWAEVHETARWHWDAACAYERPVYPLLYEGRSKLKTTWFTNPASWIRQLARFLHYCRMIGGYPMSEPAPSDRPGSELLRPYFGPESGIQLPAQKFAFVLGLLYGKLLQVQAARGVNVRANALTWLRRLTLNGKDLPELYTKVREKMLAYGRIESNPAVRELNVELAEIVASSRRFLELDEIDTCFFLLLGQSLAAKVATEDEGDAND